MTPPPPPSPHSRHRRLDYSQVAEKDDDLLLVRLGQVDSNDDGRHNACQEWLEQGATLLVHQWPKGGSLEQYKDKILISSNNSNSNLDTNAAWKQDCYALPCSYLLLLQQPTFDDAIVIGHVRLGECFESAGGNAAAVTFVVVHAPYRGRGHGRTLMQLVEGEAQRLGYHYLYLWTRTAVDFYTALGYGQSHRVSLVRPALQHLQAHQVESLEGVLLASLQRQSAASSSTNNKTMLLRKQETILLPPDSDTAGTTDVWMRKRLVEQVGSISIPLEDRLDGMLREVKGQSSSVSSWHYCLVDVPWQPQIGPSCGLAALRMVRDYFFVRAKTKRDGPSSDAASSTNHEDDSSSSSPMSLQQQQYPSLLGEAQERGYTHDGELFDAHHLLELAQQVCGIPHCTMESVALSSQHMTPCRLLQILQAGGLAIVPYDSNPFTKLPAQLGGQHAHYGVIVGMLVSTTMTERPHQNEDDDNAVRLEPLPHGPLAQGHYYYYLLVQHSLSRQLCVAPWSDFVDSNQQLDRVNEAKFGIMAKLDLKDRIIVCHGPAVG